MSKNMEGPAPPGPSPGSATGFDLPFRSFLLGFVLSYLFFFTKCDKNPNAICKQLRTSRGSSQKSSGELAEIPGQHNLILDVKQSYDLLL